MLEANVELRTEVMRFAVRLLVRLVELMGRWEEWCCVKVFAGIRLGKVEEREIRAACFSVLSLSRGDKFSVSCLQFTPTSMSSDLTVYVSGCDIENADCEGDEVMIFSSLLFFAESSPESVTLLTYVI